MAVEPGHEREGLTIKKLLIGLAAIVVFLVVAVFAVPTMIDWKNYEPDIAKAVHDATGRDLHIDGDISVSVLPLSVSNGEFRLSNAPGMPSPDMISVAGVKVKLALFPLISRSIVVESLVIHEPAIFLEVDETGRPNWILEPAVPPTPAPVDTREGLPISGLELADVRVVNGLFSFMDGTTGQSVQARDINIRVALANLASPLTVAGRTVLNDEAVTLDVTIDSPQALLGGNRAGVDFALTTRHASMTYRGGAQQTPVPGLDGIFDLDIPSVGILSAWLGQPLDESQPDPGPLQVHAKLTADGAKATLETATIKGEALDVEASGSVDGSGDITKIMLDVRTGVLDIDRYLPPPSDTPRQHGDMSQMHGKMGDAMAAIPDTPFDLSGLRQTEADINVTIGGIKAKGLEIGPVTLTTTIKDGVLKSELRELWLYGGKVTGTVTADATNDRLSLSKIVTIAGVDVGALATAATGETPIAGILSAAMEAHGSGANPRALVENLAGDMILDLGGVDAAVPITEIKLAISLPGLENPPSVTGSVVYNGQRVKIDVTHDPLATVLAGETFELSAAIVSRHINLAYDGAVQQ